MNGHWTGEWEGDLTDEHWSTPSGDSMIGMFSYVKAGKAVFYEFLLIEQTKSGPVMKLKHFNPGLIGWEEKDQVYSYPLIKFQKNEAVFERPDKLTRLTYRRTSAHTLYALLEQFKNGKRSSEGVFLQTGALTLNPRHLFLKMNTYSCLKM